MIDHAEQSVHQILPIWSHAGNENWCMIGYHGVSAVADNYLCHHPNFYGENVKRINLMPYIRNSANLDYYDHTDLYKKLGYVPYNKSAVGTSITLENAYEDWVIYHLIDQSKIAFGSEEIKGYYRQRALNFKNVFNPETGFAQARYEDGSWKTPADLLSTSNEGFIEGNSWNYSFYVPHDVNGLIKIMGGDKVFVNRLDELFTMYVPDKFFAETEDVTREGMLGGYVHGPVPLHVDLPAVEDAAARARGDEQDVPQPPRRAVRQRRLRTDVGVVHLQRDGLLSCLSGQRPVRLRCPLPARECPPSAKRKHPDHQSTQRQRPKPLHPVGDTQRHTATHRLHHLRADYGRRRARLHHGQQAEQEMVHGETLFAGVKRQKRRNDYHPNLRCQFGISRFLHAKLQTYDVTSSY